LEHYPKCYAQSIHSRPILAALAVLNDEEISVGFIASFSPTKTVPDEAGGRVGTVLSAEVYFWNIIRTHYAHSCPILAALAVLNNEGISVGLIASFSPTKTVPDEAGSRAEVYFWNIIRTHYAQSIHSHPILTALTVVNND